MKRVRDHVLLIVIGHAILVQVLTFALRPALSYAVLDAGGSAALLGVLAAGFAIPALILALPAGHWVDRVGERPALVISAVILIVSALVPLVANGSFLVFMLAAVFVGAGQVLAVLGEQSMVAKMSGSMSSDSKFGYYAFGVSLGQTIGPLLLALPGGRGSIPPLQLVFICCAGVGVLTLALSSAMRSSARDGKASPVGMLAAARTLLRTPGVPAALLASAIVLASMDLFLAYVPALGHDRGLSAAAVAAMLAIRSMLSMASRLSLGVMVRVAGRRRLMIWTITLAALALSAMAIPLPGVWLLILSGVFGFTIGISQPITLSWVSELADRQTRGLALSLRLATNRLGQSVLPPALGVFAVAAGAAGVLLSVGISLLVAAWASGAIRDASPLDTSTEVEVG